MWFHLFWGLHALSPLDRVCWSHLSDQLTEAKRNWLSRGPVSCQSLGRAPGVSGDGLWAGKAGEACTLPSIFIPRALGTGNYFEAFSRFCMLLKASCCISLCLSLPT